jgi:FeS assembly SUF system protein
MIDDTVTIPESPAVESEAPELGVEERAVEALRTIFDPEIPVNIYELGLIYDVSIEETHLSVKMTLTSPMCPVAEELPVEVQRKLGELDGVDSVDVDLVWDPTWNPDMMTEAAKLQLGML